MFLMAADKASDDEMNKINHNKGNIWGTKKYLGITLTWQVSVIC